MPLRGREVFLGHGLNLGCVVRSVPECGRILGDDFATDTALLQARFIAGNKRLFHQLESAIVRPYFEKIKNGSSARSGSRSTTAFSHPTTPCTARNPI